MGRIADLGAVVAVISAGVACGGTRTQAPSQAHPPVAAAKRSSPPPAPPAGPPAARTVDIVEDLFGTKVSDPYRWMEGEHNPERDAWLAAHGRWTAAQLARIPGRGALAQRIAQLRPGNLTLVLRRSQRALFYLEWPTGSASPRLTMREGGEPPRVLLEPSPPPGGGAPPVVAWAVVSPDEAHVAVGVVAGGDEANTQIQIVDVRTGAVLPDVAVTQLDGAAMSWTADGTGFYYLRRTHPEPEQRLFDLRAYLHRIGTAVDRDSEIAGTGVSAGMALDHHEAPIVHAAGADWLIALPSTAREDERVLVARSPHGQPPRAWTSVAGYDAHVLDAQAHGAELYLLLKQGAPNGRIVRVPLAHPDLSRAKVIVPEDPDAVVQSITAAHDALYVVDATAGIDRLWRVDYATGARTRLALPLDGTEMIAGAAQTNGVAVGLTSWLRPLHWYGERDGKIEDLGLGTGANGDLDSLAAEEVSVASIGGVEVPLSILHRKDLALDGSHPTIVMGYGGYGVSIPAFFNPLLVAWLERGGVYAVAHVRGGGEKGRRWYEDGRRDKKMNGVRDFLACADYLVAKHYTSPAKLAAQGVSMGGVLIGRAIDERPELFAAAIIEAGVLDPVRIAAWPNGPGQEDDLGSPDTATGMAGLLAMDPYQNVRPHAPYPGVLLVVGLNDQRVPPWMSGKFAARVAAATTSGRPVWLRVDGEAGHGGIAGSEAQIEAVTADELSFVLEQAGDPQFQPAAAR